ncbi:MAG: hypothetical protein IT260_20775 [Saprospiraceae bacterium]|nr:hypothetical protein [Saprospiraceae bacterium]
MTPIAQNFAAFLRSLQFLFGALLVGQLAILLVFKLVLPKFEDVPPTSDWTYPVLLLALLMWAGAFVLGRQRIRAARDHSSLPEKLAACRTAYILRWGLTEGGVLLAAVSYFLFRDDWHLAIAGIGLLLFATTAPYHRRLVEDLDLSSTEQALLDDPAYIAFEGQ